MARSIIVDGSNIAHESPAADGTPRVSNIVAVARQLRDRGYEPIVIVDASLRHQVDDPDQLEGLMDGGRVLQAPAGTDADWFVLETARREESPIVSNDTFARWGDDFGDERKRRIPLMIIGEEVQLHEPSLKETTGRA